jgi:hypothetical protein
MDDVFRRQVDQEQLLLPALELFRRETGERHPVDREFTELRARARSVRGRARAHQEGLLLVSEPPVYRKVGSNTFTIPEVVVPDATPSGPAQVPAGGRLREIFAVLADASRPMKWSEITEVLRRQGVLADVANPEAAVAAHLSRGVQLGLFTRPDRGLYAISDEVLGTS